MKKLYVRHNNGASLISTNSAPTNLATPFTAEKVQWEIHKHDDDINDPSCPHMHAIGKPWKLNLYNGDIYDINTGKIVRRLRRKELLAIWHVRGIYRIILAERARYEELHKRNAIRYPALPPVLITSPHKNRDTTNSLSKICMTGKTTQYRSSIVVQFANKPLHKKSYFAKNQLARKYRGSQSRYLRSSHLATRFSQKG